MSEVHLSALELEAWGGFLRTHAVLHQELERRLVKGQGMSLSTYDVLLRLAWAGSSGLRMRELAGQVLKTSGGLTRLADRLERDGLITRTRSADDLRGYVARLTPAGRRALRRANRQHLNDVRELFLDHLTQDQLEALAGSWRAISAGVSEISQAASAAFSAGAVALDRERRREELRPAPAKRRPPRQRGNAAPSATPPRD